MGAVGKPSSRVMAGTPHQRRQSIMVIVSKDDEGVLTGFAYFAASSTLTGSGVLVFAPPPAFALPFAFFSGFGGSGTSTGLNGFSGPGL